MALSTIEAECFAGPEDGSVVRVERKPVTVFVRALPGSWTFEESTYALEVTPEGRFRLRYVSSKYHGVT